MALRFSLESNRLLKIKDSKLPPDRKNLFTGRRSKMSLFSATIRKKNGIGEISVTVEILPHSEFHMRFDPLSPTEVMTPDGSAIEVEAMCLSGTRYARHFLPLNESRVIIRGAKGIIEPSDYDAPSIATVLAIGLALQKEELIPEKAFQGYGGFGKSLRTNKTFVSYDWRTQVSIRKLKEIHSATHPARKERFP